MTGPKLGCVSQHNFEEIVEVILHIFLASSCLKVTVNSGIKRLGSSGVLLRRKQSAYFKDLRISLLKTS